MCYNLFMEILLAVGVMAVCFALMCIGLILQRGKLCFKNSCDGKDSCSCRTDENKTTPAS